MEQVKVTDKQSPLFGKVGLLIKQSNGDYHTVSIKGVHYQIHRLAFQKMNTYIPKVESDILVKVAVEIEKIYNEVKYLKKCSDTFNTPNAQGASYAYSRVIEKLEKLLKG